VIAQSENTKSFAEKSTEKPFVLHFSDFTFPFLSWHFEMMSSRLTSGLLHSFRACATAICTWLIV